MYIKNQKFFVLGVSKSGLSAGIYILSHGGECYFYDDSKTAKIGRNIEILKEKGAKQVLYNEIDDYLSLIDVLVVSPGVPINHEIAVKAKNIKKRIIGEMELGYLSYIPPFVAITGTNGKTTTVSVIDSIFTAGNVPHNTVGNIGTPLTSKADEVGSIVNIAEVSSFQLETVCDFKPHIACVLNITPDHLERHYTMENYVFLKRRLLKNLKESEYAVLNFDDKTVKGFSEGLTAKVVWVSIREEVDGAYLKEGKLYYKGEYIIDEANLPIKGEHNVYNVLFAISASKLMGINNQSIIDGIVSFKGVPHRIELIASKDGINYYNDSKATNTASTITAIKSMSNPTVLILGGSEKGETYEDMFNVIKSSIVKHVVLTGASRFKMLESASKLGYTDITLTSDFELSVKIAKMYAESGDNILLSPACASFDCFNDYEERGEKFKKIVEGLN